MTHGEKKEMKSEQQTSAVIVGGGRNDNYKRKVGGGGKEGSDCKLKEGGGVAMRQMHVLRDGHST